MTPSDMSWSYASCVSEVMDKIFDGETDYFRELALIVSSSERLKFVETSIKNLGLKEYGRRVLENALSWEDPVSIEKKIKDCALNTLRLAQGEEVDAIALITFFEMLDRDTLNQLIEEYEKSVAQRTLKKIGIPIPPELDAGPQ